MITIAVVVIGLAAVAGLLAAFHGPREAWDVGGVPDALRQVERERERFLRAMKDLDFDLRSGVVSPEDHARLRKGFLGEARRLTLERNRLLQAFFGRTGLLLFVFLLAAQALWAGPAPGGGGRISMVVYDGSSRERAAIRQRDGEIIHPLVGGGEHSWPIRTDDEGSVAMELLPGLGNLVLRITGDEGDLYSPFFTPPPGGRVAEIPVFPITRDDTRVLVRYRVTVTDEPGQPEGRRIGVTEFFLIENQAREAFVGREPGVTYTIPLPRGARKVYASRGWRRTAWSEPWRLSVVEGGDAPAVRIESPILPVTVPEAAWVNFVEVSYQLLPRKEIPLGRRMPFRVLPRFELPGRGFALRSGLLSEEAAGEGKRAYRGSAMVAPLQAIDATLVLEDGGLSLGPAAVYVFFALAAIVAVVLGLVLGGGPKAVAPGTPAEGRAGPRLDEALRPIVARLRELEGKEPTPASVRERMLILEELGRTLLREEHRG